MVILRADACFAKRVLRQAANEFVCAMVAALRAADGAALRLQKAAAENVLILDAGMTKTAGTAPALFEILHNFELGLRHRHEHHLCNAVAGFDGESGLSAIPAGHEYLPLVIGINQSNQIAEHDAVLVAETGARQQHGGEPRRRRYGWRCRWE